MANTLIKDHHLWTRDTIKNVSGDVTLDIGRDLKLDAARDLFLAQEGDTYGLLSHVGSYTLLRLYENGGATTNDHFDIRVLANGATSLITTDAAGVAGHLTLDIDGDITLDAAGDITLDADGGDIFLKDGGTTFGALSTAGVYSGLTLNENGGASADDYMDIRTTTHGATEIRTVDDAAQAAHLTLNADGNILIGCNPGGAITLQENDATEYTPQLDSDATTKKYVDENHTVKVAEVTIAEAEMDDLHSTPQTLIAGVSGKVIVPIHVLQIVDRDASTTQASTGNMLIGINGGTTAGQDVWLSYRRWMWNESGDRIIPSVGLHFLAELIPIPAGRPLTVAMSSAITSGSIESVKFIILYHLYDV